MNELLFLFPLLFAVYLLQCIAAAPPGSVVFLLNHRLQGRRLGHSWRVGRSQQYRLYLLNPFWPATGALYVDPFPFRVCVDAEGDFLGLTELSSDPEESHVNFLSFDVPHTISCVEKNIVIDGQPWLSLRSELKAKSAADFLRKLQDAPRNKRLSVLNKEVRKLFSVNSIKRRLKQYSLGSDLLHATCFALFLFLFLWAPLLTYFLGLRHIWLASLFYLVISSSLILWLFRRCYLRLFAGEGQRPWQQLCTIALSPFAAIRANDALLANLLSSYHPLAVARQILPETEFLQFAGAELRRAKFLSGDTAFFRLLSEFLTSEKVDVHSLLSPPSREGPRSLSYCPVCLTQYVIAPGVCQDCNNISLTPFAAASGDGQ